MFRSEGNFFFVSIDAAAHCEEVPISFQHTKQKNNYEHGLPRHTHICQGFPSKDVQFFLFEGCNSLFCKRAVVVFSSMSGGFRYLNTEPHSAFGALGRVNTCVLFGLK